MLKMTLDQSVTPLSHFRDSTNEDKISLPFVVSTLIYQPARNPRRPFTNGQRPFPGQFRLSHSEGNVIYYVKSSSAVPSIVIRGPWQSVLGRHFKNTRQVALKIRPGQLGRPRVRDRPRPGPGRGRPWLVTKIE